MRLWPFIAAGMLAAVAIPASHAIAQTATVDAPVELRILAINDLHGNLRPPPGGIRIADPGDKSKKIVVPAGGVETMATVIKQLREGHANTIFVAAGDLIGASPLLSAMFHDEPTIESLSMMGLGIASVGNHEFDEGKEELLRMQNGGCHPVDGCQGPHRFTGAKFHYLAASTIDKSTGKTLFPAFEIRKFEAIPVAFIGLTLKGTANIVSPPGVAGLEFRDEAETVNALVPELKARGVEAIVVLIHEGGYPTGDYNECPGISGAIVDIVRKFDRAVEFPDDIDDGAGDAGAFVVIAGRIAALMDQHDNGLDAARLQLRNQCVHRLGLIPELEARDAGRRDDVRRALQRQADERNRDGLEFPDLESRKQGLAGALVDGGRCEIVKLRARKPMRTLAPVDRMAAAILHPQQLLLAFVEFVIADGSDAKPHHRQRLDGGFVVKHRRQERARADQIAGGDEDRVGVALAKLLDDGRHGLDAAGRHDDLFRLVAGIGDPDAARRRPQIAVKIVDGENSQFDRGIDCRGLGDRMRSGYRHGRQHPGRNERPKPHVASPLLAGKERLERGNRFLGAHAFAEQMAFLVDPPED